MKARPGPAHAGALRLRAMESSRLVLRAFDVLPVSVAVLDGRGTIVAVNRAWERMTRENAGDPARTGCGQNYLNVCAAAAADPDARAAGDGLRAVLSGSARSFEHEYPCHSPDRQRWFLMWIGPLGPGDGDGGAGGAVVVHLDITRRRLAEIALDERARELERSNEDLTAFGRIVAHDLKEPLRGMKSYATFVLEDDAGLEDRSRARLESIVRLADRTATTVDGLLHYARAGMGEPALQPTDLNEVAHDVIDSFRPQFEGAHARAALAGPLPRVRCDPHMVREAMANLVANAIKYNDKAEKRIEIGPAPMGFYVRDNGIGIPAAAQEHVLEPFTRVHTDDRFGSGSGLGLSIVRRIAERHHGSVRIRSTPGEGSTFTVTLGDPGTARP